MRERHIEHTHRRDQLPCTPMFKRWQTDRVGGGNQMRRGSGRRSGGELQLAKNSVVSTLSNEESLLTAVAAVTPAQLEPGREELNPAAGLSKGARKLGICVQQSWLLPWDECFGQDPDWQQAISDV